MPLQLPIRTPRLWLRDFVSDDLDAVHHYASDPIVTRYMFYGPRTLPETRDYLEGVLVDQHAQPRRMWELGVVEAATQRLVGACDLTLESEAVADLGFIFSREVWGRGYATEVAGAMVRLGFQDRRLRRIFSTCDVENVASARVLEKSGLRRESTLREHKYAKGRWWTSFLYSIDRVD